MTPPRGREHWIATLAVALLGSCASSSPSNGRFACPDLMLTVSPKEALRGATLRATTSIAEAGGADRKRAWTVTRAGESTPLPYRALDAVEASIELLANEPGTYHFEVEATTRQGRCATADDATVKTPDGKVAVYYLRVTPPVASGLPRQSVVTTIYERTPLDHQRITLKPGLAVNGVLSGPQGAIAGTVRYRSSRRLDVDAAAGADGRFQALLLADEEYRPLLVPESDALAPRLGPSGPGATLLGAAYTVDAGVVVSGLVRDDKGAAIVGARLAMRRGELPSGVGRSDAKGGFALRAGAGLYDLALQVDDSLELDASGVAIAADSRLEFVTTVDRVAVTGKLFGSDGVTAMGGARVTLRSVQPLPKRGRLVVSGGAAIDLAALVEHTVFTGPDGLLPPLALPPGSYDLTTEPPSPSRDGVSVARLLLDRTMAVRLDLKPRLRTRAVVVDSDGKPVGGVRVTAVGRGGRGAAAQSLSEADGGYTVELDVGLAWDIYYDPPARRSATAARRTHLVLAAGAAPPAQLRLGRGLLYRGVVEPPSGAELVGALVEAFCAGCAESAPMAVAATDGSGQFTLYLPDPAE